MSSSATSPRSPSTGTSTSRAAWSRSARPSASTPGASTPRASSTARSSFSTARRACATTSWSLDKEATMDERSFERRVIEQRRAMRASPEELLERVERSPYGPKSKQILRQMVAHESTGQVGFALFDCPPAIVRGKGARVWDADDKEYVDMLAGFSVSNLCHAHPAVLEAGREKIPSSYPYRGRVGADPEQCAEACVEFVRRVLRGRETLFGDAHAVSNVAAILVEPMQASAGYIIPGEGYLRGLHELCS